MTHDEIQFLIRAKQKTYAGKGAETAPTRPGSHDLVCREGNLMYYDTYLGGECFAGEEGLWIAERPCWSMNYIGRVMGAGFSGDFLKEALRNVPEDMPYRGPAEYSSGGYTYHMECTGTVDWFQGWESITCQGIQIYECRFHGGSIR